MNDKHIVVMGVAGCGKSTVGETVARELGVSYVEGDDFHLPESREKMSQGIPLTDADRFPWLDALNALMTSSDEPLVVSCSALKQIYRERLGAGINLLFVFLDVPEPDVLQRVRTRDHFLPESLVADQFAVLEVPTGDNVIGVDARRPLDEVVADVQVHLKAAL